MNLRFVPVDAQKGDIVKTKNLFENAFPEDERPPFEMMMAWNHDTFYGVYDGGEYVGLVDLIEHEDLLYVFFLAILPEKRNQGFGTAILAKIRDDYPLRRIFLLADEATPRYPDYPLRLRRLGFYARNGFKDIGISVNEFGVTYRLLCLREPVSKEEFVRVMASLIGEENTRKYYANV